jgi:hypothetical protein
MTNEDQAQAVLVAVANWLAQIVKNNPEDFSGNSPGKGVSVVIADMDGDSPRVELYVAGRLLGHTALQVRKPSAVN